MKVKLKLHTGEYRETLNIRERIKDCADTIIDNLDISQYIFDEFGHDLNVNDYEKLNNMVWNELKNQIK